MRPRAPARLSPRALPHPGGEAAVLAALSASSAALDREFRVLYATVIRALMSGGVRRPLEELMNFEGSQLDDDVLTGAP